MRELIIDKIIAVWDDSLEVIHNVKLHELPTLSDRMLLELYDNIFEYLCK